MVQCTAFTKTRRRCLNHAQLSGTCIRHSSYYINWLIKHPAPLGFRLDLEEKEEYMFQIGNGYVLITEDYVKSLKHRDEADYYEYLLHLTHITWDSNMKMLLFLFLNFLNQDIMIPITRNNLEYYFSNMFRNPSFCNPTFVMRLLHTIDEKRRTPTMFPNLTENRIVEVLECIINHPVFEGFLYMYWLDELISKMPTNNPLNIFIGIVKKKKQDWQNEKIKTNTNLSCELLKIAMSPDRVLDWYIDCETKKDISMRFLAGQ